MTILRQKVIGIGKILIKLKLGLTIEVQDVGCQTCQKIYYCWANQPKMVLSLNL
jgi:hypothetical protein